MSWILITTLAVLVIFGIVGWQKGIIKIVVSMTALIISILLTAFLSPVVAQTIKKNTKIYDNLCESVYKILDENEEMKSAVDNTISENYDVVIDEDDIKEHQGVIGNYMEQIKDKVNLPDCFGTAISDTLNEISSNEYVIGLTDGASTVKEIVLKAFAVRLADIILQAIVYVVIFIIIYIVLQVIVLTTGLISKLPIIHGANKILGLAFGLVEGLLVVWLLYVALTAMGRVEFAVNAINDINNNNVLRFLYENNVIMKMIFR